MKYTLLLIISIISIETLQAQTWGNDQAAAKVIGQTNFTSGGSGTTATKFNFPAMAIVDPSTGKVFVSDANNNRILRFASVATATSGVAAEAVLGQTSFTASGSGTSSTEMNFPQGIALDNSGNLWVADAGNNRVLEFLNAATIASGAAASLVIGQTNFTSTTSGITASTLHDPESVFISNNTLWVSDADNNRVLQFNDISAAASGASASSVFGQANFTSNGAGTANNQLSFPEQIYVDANGSLWVADYGNSRVLRFDNAASLSSGSSANGILGATSTFGTTQSYLSFPTGVYGDSGGRIYVGDNLNSRVLIFNNAATLANGSNASNVLGQTSFTVGSGNLSTTGLTNPKFVFVSATQLFIADANNNRIIVQNPGTILPVKLTSFTGILLNNNEVSLQWQTADETSIKDYELEYCTDGISYSTILTTETPQGAPTNNYSYLHTTPSVGTNYYRIKIVNDDGSFSYSNIVPIDIQNDNTAIISPNPATDNIVIALPNANKSVVNIYNSTGILVKTTTVYSIKNTLDIHNLPSGTYFINVIENGATIINKTFIKE
ncbi:MAG TPA: T9SS type A sorting domain-containing protein [Ferruginibacter sp.]|jgi:sugar lactone lactonase YvrE|nr:T9SS type A sorting domain-containing protein [Ferruginibacter sp.]